MFFEEYHFLLILNESDENLERNTKKMTLFNIKTIIQTILWSESKKHFYIFSFFFNFKQEIVDKNLKKKFERLEIIFQSKIERKITEK